MVYEPNINLMEVHLMVLKLLYANVTVDVRLKCQAMLSGVCHGRSGPKSTWVFSYSYHATSVRTHSFVTDTLQT